MEPRPPVTAPVMKPDGPADTEAMLAQLYGELRKAAEALCAGEPAGGTLQPTALVHEAYLRLTGGGEPPRWDSPGHFFVAAATAMRRVLVDAARRRRSLKRGGGLVRHPLGEVPGSLPEPREDLIALDAALEKLAATHRQAAELVQLRYFAGLTLPQSARVLELSPRGANRLWSYARAWLRRELADES